uniref:Uncharacterized protein n=1 Tax=Aegilops tauschii subsp. strangulata TaxID=200361 RepID=A0A453HVE0_AEGTS
MLFLMLQPFPVELKGRWKKLNGVPSVTFKTSQDYKGAVKEKMLWIHSGRGELPTMYQG